jgi:hypothetical protein
VGKNIPDPEAKALVERRHGLTEEGIAKRQSSHRGIQTIAGIAGGKSGRSEWLNSERRCKLKEK